LLASVLVAGVSHADPGDRREEAAAHYEQGLQLANQGQFQEALDEFDAAYAASPHYAVLYNVGQAQMALGRPIEAIAALTRYLQDGADQVPLSRRELVRAQITLLEAKLAELTISTERPGVAVRVDDREIGLTPLPQPVRLPAGTHAVTAALPHGGASVTRQITLAEGERQNLEMVLPAPVQRPVASETPAALPIPLVTNRPEPRSPVITLRRAAVFVAATGLVLGGAALGVYVWNGGRYEDWQNANAALRNIPPGTSDYRQSAIANNQLADSLARANDAILVLSLAGGALVATGVVLYVVDRAHRGRSAELALAWTRSPGGGPTPILGWSVAW
jgi:tetratricopeptide (TPR) repeat protein